MRSSLVLAWFISLGTSVLTDPLPVSKTNLVEKSADFAWDRHSLETGIALALSGGGFRAMLFHAGSLMRLNELGILARVARISSVSGGAIAAGYLARIWSRLDEPDARGAFGQFKQKYVEPLFAFSRETLDVVDILIGLLPWTSAADQLAGSYNEKLFHGMTLQDLPSQPQFIFCATNLQTGVNFRFSKFYAGDYVIGRFPNPNVSMSTAIAASSAFPPFFSPLELALPAGSFTDWSDQIEEIHGSVDLTRFREKVSLADGGVYDNHGLEPVVKRYMTLLVSDGGARFSRTPNVGSDPIRQLQHVFDVTDHQVRSLRRRDLIGRFKAAREANLQENQIDGHARFGAYWGIDTDPAKVAPPGALPCTMANARTLAGLPTTLSDLGAKPSKQLVNWGYAISDRCIRTHCNIAETGKREKPAWPYPDVALG
jgi:NTE family protein